jgi:histidinol-phosphate phosphatase family protein
MILQDLKIDHTWTLFLDRDGVINRRLADDYVKRWEEFEFLPGVPLALKLFGGLFGRIIVVSNQQGVGKGLMKGSEVEEIHRKMTETIQIGGGRIDAVFFSPHLQSDRSFMRKPNVGMALNARKKFPEIRFKHSVMAGDSLSDMIFGKRVGMKTILISTEPEIAARYPRYVDFQFPDLISMASNM